jgi:hypothetical protein
MLYAAYRREGGEASLERSGLRHFDSAPDGRLGHDGSMRSRGLPPRPFSFEITRTSATPAAPLVEAPLQRGTDPRERRTGNPTR